ncbi:MAG: hypothetical protein PHE55_11825 [Methylococcaceae bacterium]|nr:hypothetical protein [Methylococcaceae bacterium]
MPGKAQDDEKPMQAQQAFYDNQRQPRLEEAKQGRRTVLFVDATLFCTAPITTRSPLSRKASTPAYATSAPASKAKCKR